MGGGGGGFSGPIDVDKIADAANERIKNAFKESDYVIFVCARSDINELEQRISSTINLAELNYRIMHEHDDIKMLSDALLVIIYTGDLSYDDFYMSSANAAFGLKKTLLTTKSKANIAIPTKIISQLRIRLYNWLDLSELLSS